MLCVVTCPPDRVYLPPRQGSARDPYTCPPDRILLYFGFAERSTQRLGVAITRDVLELKIAIPVIAPSAHLFVPHTGKQLALHQADSTRLSMDVHRQASGSEHAVPGQMDHSAIPARESRRSQWWPDVRCSYSRQYF